MADPNRSPPLDLQAFHRVRKLCLEGLSIPDIARSMGRSKAQIDKAVRFMGGVAKIKEGIETMPDAATLPADGETAEEILGYRRHPASAVWPDLAEEEFSALRQNIDDQGQDAPILVTTDRQVIDGWHRLRACADIDLKPSTMIVHFDEEEIARKVIGAHTGRRHMTKIDMARLSIETMKACGMEHATEGDRRSPEQRGQVDPSAPGKITRRTVARDANVSQETARRAIREDKRKSGLLPPKTPQAQREEGGAQPDPGSQAETVNRATEQDKGAALSDAAGAAAEGASSGGEGASNGAGAPSSPADAAGEPRTPEASAGADAAQQADAVTGEPDPSSLEAIRRALAQLQADDPADVVAVLDAEQIGEFYDLGQAAVDVGFAMVRAAGPHRAQTATAAGAAPKKPTAEDGALDIPPFLDRRGDATQSKAG